MKGHTASNPKNRQTSNRRIACPSQEKNFTAIVSPPNSSRNLRCQHYLCCSTIMQAPPSCQPVLLNESVYVRGTRVVCRRDLDRRCEQRWTLLEMFDV